MTFDIYGQPLRLGHCEVHPGVWGEYPCSLCIQETQQASDQRDHEEAMREQYEEDMKQQAIDEWQGLGGGGI